MKNLLVLTDFSIHAKHAAEYAYKLAKKIEANLILLNAIIVPAEMPQAGVVVWPMDEPEFLEDESRDELEKLKEHLKEIDQSHDKKPQIGIVNQSGYLQDVVMDIITDQAIDLVVMGTHKAGLGSFILGNHTRNMIDSLKVPLLLIPSRSKIAPFRDIYFASDFSDIYGDGVFLGALIPLARAFKAEIFIVHVSATENLSKEISEKTKLMMLDLNSDLGYPGIHLISINEKDKTDGLNKLMAKCPMDLLVMVHRKKSFMNSFLQGSLTQKLAKELDFPLLIFKAKPEAKHIA